MELMIILKNGNRIDIENFKEIKYFQQEWKSIDTDFSQIILTDATTYNFIGDSKVITKGIEISYIDIH
ncbi:hypothetical protein [Vagococcus sp.]|uniref:hypothetical protein n=1 Tax=Vagococcus sp. TaxID=1933889 RepID=UPI002FC6DB04